MDNRYTELQEQYDLLSQKIDKLRRAHAIENDVTTRFKYEKQIEEEEQERDKIRRALGELEYFYKTNSYSPQKPEYVYLQRNFDERFRIEYYHECDKCHYEYVVIESTLERISYPVTIRCPRCGHLEQFNDPHEAYTPLQMLLRLFRR